MYYLHATFETTDACPMLFGGKLKEQFNESQIRLKMPMGEDYYFSEKKESLLNDYTSSTYLVTYVKIIMG